MMTTNRRTFIAGALSGPALTTIGCMGPANTIALKATVNTNSTMDLIVPKMDVVRFGIIGLGQRGGSLLPGLLHVEGAQITAICDTYEPTVEKHAALIKEKTGLEPARYTGRDDAYKDLLDRDDVDAVIIATPWSWHTPMAVHAMKAGKHAFVEVPAALTLDECWELVDTSEATQRNCMMMENVNYGRSEMMVLNMVRLGLFGDLTHGEGAYIHDLRWQMKEIERGTGSWRTFWHAKRNANLYPTHGLGPIAQYMNINRGDRFDYLTAAASPALGRKAYAAGEFSDGHNRNQLKYIVGDMHSSLITTAKGRTILVQHDTTTPRPYTRLNHIQGTNGAFAGFPDRIALENNPLTPDVKDGFHKWDAEMDKWRDTYDHPVWKTMLGEAERQGGHGGMDFVMLWRMVYCLRNGLPLDQNVYDAAAWSSVIPLSEQSVSNRSSSADVPDFTRGVWKTALAMTVPM